MALLSTCINLMQEQLLDKCRWLSKEIGLSKPDNDDQDDNKIENIKNKPKKKKKKVPSTIPEDAAEQGLPAAAADQRSPSAGRLRLRGPSQDSVPSSPVDSNTLGPPQTLASMQSESRSPSPFALRSNCSTPIPGSLEDPD